MRSATLSGALLLLAATAFAQGPRAARPAETQLGRRAVEARDLEKVAVTVRHGRFPSNAVVHVKPDGEFEALGVEPGQITLRITFTDASAAGANARSYFESRSNTVRRVAPSPLLRGEWLGFEAAPYIYSISGPGVTRTEEDITRKGDEITIRQDLAVAGDQPVTIRGAVRRAPEGLRFVP